MVLTAGQDQMVAWEEAHHLSEQMVAQAERSA
jgi:hypothetical protein